MTIELAMFDTLGIVATARGLMVTRCWFCQGTLGVPSLRGG